MPSYRVALRSAHPARRVYHGHRSRAVLFRKPMAIARARELVRINCTEADFLIMLRDLIQAAALAVLQIARGHALPPSSLIATFSKE